MCAVSNSQESCRKGCRRLKQAGMTVKVEKTNIVSREVVGRYGVLVSPALAVNGVVKIMGRVPSEEEVEKLIREAAEKGT